MDDDVAFQVSAPGALLWPLPPFDGGINLWHIGPARDLVVSVAARSPTAVVNQSGAPSVDLQVHLVQGMAQVNVHVRAPSGKEVNQAVTVLATRALAPDASCFIGANGVLDCGGELNNSSLFVAATTNGCGVNVEGELWCYLNGAWARHFSEVSAILDASPPCVRTREGLVFCESAGVIKPIAGTWTAIECRRETCCGLDLLGTARCWGKHEYDLFGVATSGAVYPDPIRVPGLPGSYDRLSSAVKTFFGQTPSGDWSAATLNIGFPGPAPYVLPQASLTTVKLDSPQHCVMGLESDGGLWTAEDFLHLAPPRPADPGAGAYIDFVAHPSEFSRSFYTLSADRVLGLFVCPPP